MSLKFITMSLPPLQGQLRENVASTPPIEAQPEQGMRPDDQRTTEVRGLVTGEFMGEEPDALFVLSGGIVVSPNSESGYKSLAWSNTNELGISTGGRTRVIAVVEVARVLPEIPIVTNSRNRFDNTQPTMASISKAELVRRGVDPDRVILEEDSVNTITQLTEMVQLALRNNWTSIAVLVNDYYQPRIHAIWNRLGELVTDADFQAQLTRFKGTGGTIGFISSEPIMRAISPLYAAYLHEVEASAVYQRTVESEANGLRALQEGRYKPVTLKPDGSK